MGSWHFKFAVLLSLFFHGAAAVAIYSAIFPSVQNESITIGEVEFVSGGGAASAEIRSVPAEPTPTNFEDIGEVPPVDLELRRAKSDETEMRLPITPRANVLPASTGESEGVGTLSSAPLQIGASQSGQEVTYEVLLARALERVKVYPRRAIQRGIEGEALLRLTLARSGQVVDSEIASSAGHPLLDEEVLDMVSKAQPFPPILDGGPDAISFNVPIRFELR